VGAGNGKAAQQTAGKQSGRYRTRR
jgi:hypothetical protein